MADNDTSSPRRRPGAYQPIEPIDEPQRGTAAPPGTASPAESAQAPAPPVPEPQQEAPATAPQVPIAARFGSAAASLVFAGQLLSISQATTLTFGAEEDRAYWVLTELDLDIARELVQA